MPSAAVQMFLRWVLRAYGCLMRSVYRIQHGFKALLRPHSSTHDREEDARQRMIAGCAWNDFCDTLKAAGAVMLAPGAPKDALSQAEGYRYLSRLTRLALENFVECSDVESPVLCAIANGARAAPVKLGSDNPDNLYESARIDGRLEYVVTGSRGSVVYLGFGTQSGSYGSKGGLATVGYVEADQLEYEDTERKTFTIILSATRPPDALNWLRLLPEPAEAMFIVRQTFGDRTTETPAEIQISRRGHAAGPAPLSALKLEAGLRDASVLVAGASAMFAKWAHDFQAHTNQLPLFDQRRSDAAGGDPNIRYFHSYWRLGLDAALRIRVRPPPCRCWNFQLNNHWMESLDYRHHPIHINNTLARADDSGETYTIIIAHTDPNAGATFHGNWISTVGHECGTMCFRWVAPEVDDAVLPHPTIEEVPFGRL